ncbi:MAG: O-antigen ligase family protein [Actinomycetota bacterium]
MILTVFVGIVGLAAFIGLTAYFISLENRGDTHRTFLILMTVLLVEATLAGHAANTPTGILRPTIAGQDFRPPDLIILPAVLARLLGGTRRRFPMEQLYLFAYLGWYAFGIIPGIANGFQLQQALFQGKSVFYLAGGMLIASGADLRKLADQLGRWGQWLAVIVVATTIFQLADISIRIDTPVQRINRLLQLGNDSITLYSSIGLVILAIEAHREHPRLRQSLAGVVMVLAPLGGSQRASYLAVAMAISVIGILLFTPTFARRRTVTPVQIGLVGAAIAGLMIAALAVGPGRSVLTNRVDDAFGGEQEINSALERFELADQAISRIEERPVLGWGLGVTVNRTARGRTINTSAHNFILDITMRAGVVGLVMFTLVIASIIRRGLIRWRDEPDNLVAGLKVGAVIAIAVFLAKGLVEPAVDKYRLVLTAATAFGLILAPGVGLDDDDTDPDDASASPAAADLAPRLGSSASSSYS